jgi:AraC family transcriptional regulator
MTPIDKALWLIENRLDDVVSRNQVARFAKVSCNHLLRASGSATGQSVMRSVRARRLTTAARPLASGAPDILGVALDAGYRSRKAFTRAFREHFGITPEAVRAQRHTDNITLVKAISMDENLIVPLEAPHFEAGRALLIAGLGVRYTFETSQGIPEQWQRFAPYIDNIPDQIGRVAYGVCCNSDGTGSFKYVADVEVASFAGVPEEFSGVCIAAQCYTVFSHRAHIAALRATVYTIWSQWLPASGHTIVDAPDFERYDERFDARTGLGTIEIWLPIGA